MFYWEAFLNLIGVRAIQNSIERRRHRKIDRLYKEIEELRKPKLNRPERDDKGRWILHPSASDTCCGGGSCSCKKSN